MKTSIHIQWERFESDFEYSCKLLYNGNSLYFKILKMRLLRHFKSVRKIIVNYKNKKYVNEKWSIL